MMMRHDDEKRRSTKGRSAIETMSKKKKKTPPPPPPPPDLEEREEDEKVIVSLSLSLLSQATKESTTFVVFAHFYTMYVTLMGEQNDILKITENAPPFFSPNLFSFFETLN